MLLPRFHSLILFALTGGGFSVFITISENSSNELTLKNWLNLLSYPIVELNFGLKSIREWNLGKSIELYRGNSQ